MPHAPSSALSSIETHARLLLHDVLWRASIVVCYPCTRVGSHSYCLRSLKVCIRQGARKRSGASRTPQTDRHMTQILQRVLNTTNLGSCFDHIQALCAAADGRTAAARPPLNTLHKPDRRSLPTCSLPAASPARGAARGINTTVRGGRSDLDMDAQRRPPRARCRPLPPRDASET